VSVYFCSLPTITSVPDYIGSFCQNIGLYCIVIIVRYSGLLIHNPLLLESSKEDVQAKKVYQKSNKQFVSLIHKQEQLLRGMS